MKILIIGGTGIISSAVAAGCLAAGHEVSFLNRGSKPAPAGVHQITADMDNEQLAAEKLAGEQFDTVCEFIGFTPAQAERDIRLFSGRTRQFIYTSSASAYQKPVHRYPITEETPLVNPYWEYSRNKAASEAVYRRAFEEKAFPVTVVRPSHTYNETRVPVSMHGKNGPWQVIKRILDHKPVIIPGDGTSLWTATYAADFAAGYCGLIGNEKAVGEAYHITSDEVLTWNEIYAAAAAALDRELKAVHIPSEILAADGAVSGYDFGGQLLGDKANSVIFDNTRIRTLVPSFRCKTGMHEGIAAAARYMASHPEVQKADPAFDAWCDAEILKYRQ